MAHKRDLIKGPNQELFRGGPSNRRPVEDMTEAQAEQIAKEMDEMGLSGIRILPTKDLKGKVRGYAVEYQSRVSRRSVLVGTPGNWRDHKRRMFEDRLKQLGLHMA